MRPLRIAFAAYTPELGYVAQFLAVSAGFRLVFVEHGGSEPIDIAHGIDTTAAPITIPLRPNDRLWAELIDGRLAPEAVESSIPVDILHATAAHLTDSVHGDLAPAARDSHGRLRSCASFAARAGFDRMPIVNRFVEVFASVVSRTIGIEPMPRWPFGRCAAIGLSHDVDRPDKYAILRAIRTGRFMRPRSFPYYFARVGHDFLQWTRDRDRNGFWLFDQITEMEREAGVSSSFLFATMPAYGAYGSTHDVLYDPAWPHFRPVFERLQDDGFDIGLHASYNAYAERGRIAHEKALLEAITGASAIGIRHHYWHLGPDEAATLREHETAGFRYDSSMAFNDRPGFRRSVALPFRPWDAHEARPLRVLQLPVAGFDSAIMRRKPVADDALKELRAVVNTVKGNAGLGVIDWHVRTSMPANREFFSWGETYRRIVEELADDTDLWVTDLRRITEWVEDRERKLADPSP